MKKFYVSFDLSAKVEVGIDAETEDEAYEKAEQFMADADFGPCEDIEWVQVGEIETDE